MLEKTNHTETKTMMNKTNHTDKGQSASTGAHREPAAADGAARAIQDQRDGSQNRYPAESLGGAAAGYPHTGQAPGGEDAGAGKERGSTDQKVAEVQAQDKGSPEPLVAAHGACNRDSLEYLSEQLSHYLLDPEFGLTNKKLSRMENARVEGGKLVFTMDRHRAVACSHVKGCRMAAFVEMQETYAFDPAAQAIDCLGSEFVRFEADYEEWAYSQLEDSHSTVTRIGPRRFSYRPPWGKETIVTSYRQAAELVEDEVLNWDLDALLGELKDHMSPQEVADVEAKLLDACIENALSGFRSEWERMLAEDVRHETAPKVAKTSTAKSNIRIPRPKKGKNVGGCQKKTKPSARKNDDFPAPRTNMAGRAEEERYELENKSNIKRRRGADRATPAKTDYGS